MRRTASEILNELENRVARLERQSTSIDGIDLGFKSVNHTLSQLIDMLMSKLKRHNKKISERQWTVLQNQITKILTSNADADRKRKSIYLVMDKIGLASWNLETHVELLLNKAIKASE